MGKKRNVQVNFRMTEEEFEVLREKVEQSGMSQREFLCRCALDKVILNVDSLKVIVPEMKKQGSNLNQIAKRLNERKFVDYNNDLSSCLQEVEETWQSLKQFLHMHQ